MSLESPEADKYLNSGTSAPDCQPKHTKDKEEEGQEVGLKETDSEKKHRRGSSMNEQDDDRRKRQHTSGSSQNLSQQQQQQKKLSYYQMARLGYQELVNAIIRPPRAEYKVCNAILHFLFVSSQCYSLTDDVSD